MSRPEPAAGLDRILDYVRQVRGVDFREYKPRGLTRRLRQRMQSLGIDDVDAYLLHLQRHSEESAALFDTILINVTSFFRDAEVWDALRDRVVPNLAAVRASHGPIRVWSAGCASGQEAYSAAILLAEILGADAFKHRVTIFATDVDDEALSEARRGRFSAGQVGDVPRPLLAKYFTRTNGDERYRVDGDLRRSIVFGHHDLIQDPPIARLDLILCRNTLMYFNAEAQARILARFAQSLNPGGHLTLGRAERWLGHATAGEALPSAGEPLETLNEELRSTDAALQNLHGELRNAMARSRTPS